jgi:aerobic-type carbon monoxide dehydrogenase small subunit (CoxS/CutS family)
LKINLNGRDETVPALLENDPLLFVLRDGFGLNGPKFGCGEATCGACLVHVDGVALPSCQLTCADVAGRQVVTLEGLGAGHKDGLHPVQHAFLVHSVPQCGYCQNGQVMAASALLAANPRPDEPAVAAAMDPVLCRCGTQTRIRAAIHAAARAMAEVA